MWFLGMDVGTGGTRAVIVDSEGRPIAAIGRSSLRNERVRQAQTGGRGLAAGESIRHNTVDAARAERDTGIVWLWKQAAIRFHSGTELPRGRANPFLRG
jgi:ribulose kinase